MSTGVLPPRPKVANPQPTPGGGGGCNSKTEFGSN